MIEIAEALKKQREAKGFTIDDLFQRTRINTDFLRALESGQFHILPETYVRLFIKKYAQEVGLNVEEILSEYDKNIPQKEVSQPQPPSSREINFQPAILITIGVFIIALLIWQVRQQTNQNTATLLEATTSQTPTVPRTSPTPSATVQTPILETPQALVSEPSLEESTKPETPQPIEAQAPNLIEPTESETPQPIEERSTSGPPPVVAPP
ncbi:MAG: helix-turn-helix domain-containing protein, partial [Candidatus Latescibacterota bacterium]